MKLLSRRAFSPFRGENRTVRSANTKTARARGVFLSCGLGIALTLSFAVSGTFGERPKANARVLFLGNSVFNYRGGVCQSFEGFCREAGLEWEAVSQWTKPENAHGIEFLGYGRIPLNLPEVAADERIHRLIREGEFDYVVLEARRPGYLVPEWVDRPKDLKLGEAIPYERNLESLGSLHRSIVRSGARTVMYQHPGHHVLPDWKRPVGRIYERLRDDLEAIEIDGKRHEVTLVSASFLWLDALRHFELTEWYSDSNHGTNLARYASACMLFAYLTGEDPRENPFRTLPKEWTEGEDSASRIAAPGADAWIKRQVWFYYSSE